MDPKGNSEHWPYTKLEFRPCELWKKLLLLFVNLATYLREDFRVSFATTVWAFAEHMGKQELSRPFRGESGGAYLRPKALLFVHCKENRRRLAVSGGHVFFVLLLVVCRSVRRRWSRAGVTIGTCTCQLSRLSRSTFAFAIFREAAFSFRAGTPD